MAERAIEKKKVFNALYGLGHKWAWMLPRLKFWGLKPAAQCGWPY